jgi:phenylacetate-coenzyme A ligase PaaK-like adenylate-forming protein
MTQIPLRTFPGYAWPQVPDAGLAQVWVAYKELERTQWLPPEELERRQLQQLRVMLAHAIVEVPYYRRTLAAAGICPGDIQSMADFRRLPRLSRAEYHAHRHELLAAKLPAGTVVTDSAHTSGSSGIPLVVPHTNIVNLWWCAFFLRDLDWCGMDLTGSLAAIRVTGHTGAELERWLAGTTSRSWMPLLESLIETGPAYGMDIQQYPERQLQWLRHLAPDYVLSVPTNLEVLASMALDDGKGIPGLRGIQTIGEPLSEHVRRRIENAFDVPVKNTYSCCEAGYLASPCPQADGWHVHAENVILEVLDEAGQPCGAGQTGTVFLTTLHNFRAPFLRYGLGDEVTLGAGRCTCGRGLPLVTRIDGKSRPIFHLPGGGRKNSTPLANMLRDVGGHRQHQLIQKAVDHVVVRLVPDASWTDAHGERLRRKLHEFFEAPIRVELLIQDRIDPGAGGKVRSLVCEIG